MQIITVPCGPIMANSYLVFADGSASCAVIDPADGPLLIRLLAERGLCCTHILLTHGHFDHVCGAQELKDATGALVYLHQKDALLAEGLGQPPLSAGFRWPPCRGDVFLREGEEIQAGGLRFSVLETPGHTPGGLCYLVKEEKTVFTGDTLFFESVGRTDLGGNEQDLLHSLFHKLYPLEGYAVYPGHDEPTTIDHERQHNPMNVYLRRQWFN